jgi:hypothetical protein
MTRSFLAFAGLLTGLFTAPTLAGQARALQRTRIFNQPSRPGLRRRAVLEHRFTDPYDNKLVGVIRLGDPQPGNSSPLYKGGFSCTAWGSRQSQDDRRGLIGNNSVTFIDTAANAVKHTTTYVGRSPRSFLHARWQRSLGDGARRRLHRRPRRTHFRGNNADQGACRSGDADFLARWQIRLRLFVVQPGDRSHLGGRSCHRRPGRPGEPVLPRSCGDA